MVNRLYLLFSFVVALFVPNTSPAQEILVHENCSGIGARNKMDSQTYFDNKTKTLFIATIASKKLMLHSYKDFIKKDSYTFTRTEQKNLFFKIKGSSMNIRDEFILFYEAKKGAVFSVTSINLKNGSIRHKPSILILTKEERYLYSFSQNGTFYILTCLKNKSSLILHKFDLENERFQSNPIPLDGIYFQTRKSPQSTFWDVYNTLPGYWYDFFGYSKYNGYKRSYYDQNNEHDPAVLASHLKFFPNEQTLFITIDGFENVTQLIKIDLQNYSHSYTSFPFEDSESYYSKKQTNSIIYGNNLAQVSCTNNELIVYLSEIDSSFSEKTKIIPPPVLKINENFVNTNEETESIKKILRKASNHNIFIDLTTVNNSTSLVQIGSYYVVETNNYNGGSHTKTNYFANSVLLNTNGLVPLKSPDLKTYDFLKLMNLKEKFLYSGSCYKVFQIEDEYYFCFFDNVTYEVYDSGPPKVYFTIYKL